MFSTKKSIINLTSLFVKKVEAEFSILFSITNGYINNNAPNCCNRITNSI